MNRNKKSYGKKAIPTIKCISCGKTLRQRKRRNFPFGKNGNSRLNKYYKCTSCNKRY